MRRIVAGFILAVAAFAAHAQFSPAFPAFVQDGTGAKARAWIDKARDVINAKDYGVVANGTTSDTAALQAAINAAAGRPIILPVGTLVIDGAGVSYVTTSASSFVQGVQLIGQGEDKTFIDNRVASGYAITIDTNTTGKFQRGVRLAGFTIKTTTNPLASNGIKLRRAYNVEVEHVVVTGLTGDCMQIVVNEGDADGSVNVTLRHSRLTSCAGWGLNVDIAAGLNELSFVKLDHTFIESNGTVSAATPPPSGGMKYRGQILHMIDGACVTNENVGLYLVGGAGAGNTATVRNWAFENNKKRHAYVEGIIGALFEQVQFYSNDSFIATAGLELNGTPGAIRNVLVDGAVVRVTSGNNAFTAFKVSGTFAEKNSIRARRVSWLDFDYAGQTRFDGFLFDIGPGEVEFVALGTNLARLRATAGVGNRVPVKIKATGEWMMAALDSTAYPAGIGKDNTGLVANTTYYAYVYNNGSQNDPVLELEYSTTVPAVDAASGVRVKTGDSTRTLVGAFRTDGSTPGQFQTSRPMLTRSWFVRPAPADTRILGATTSTASTTNVELSSTIRLEAVVWSDEVFDVRVEGAASNSTAGAGGFAGIGFNGTTAEDMTGGVNSAALSTGLSIPIHASALKSGLTEGYNYATVTARTTGSGTVFFPGTGTASTSLTIKGALVKR